MSFERPLQRLLNNFGKEQGWHSVEVVEDRSLIRKNKDDTRTDPWGKPAVIK